MQHFCRTVSRPLLFTLWCCLLAASVAVAQSADLPAAPSATPAKASTSIFVVPKSSQLPASSPGPLPPQTPDVADACYAPAEGIYAHQPEIAAALRPALDRYRSVAHQRIGTMWFHNMPRAANDPWLKRAGVTVRFAILPDGSIDPPVVTASSGRSSYDHHALEAIRQASPFDPLPQGVVRPLSICFTFNYHVDEDDTRPHTKDLLPYPERPVAPRQPAPPPS